MAAEFRAEEGLAAAHPGAEEGVAAPLHDRLGPGALGRLANAVGELHVVDEALAAATAGRRSATGPRPPLPPSGPSLRYPPARCGRRRRRRPPPGRRAAGRPPRKARRSARSASNRGCGRRSRGIAAIVNRRQQAFGKDGVEVAPAPGPPSSRAWSPGRRGSAPAANRPTSPAARRRSRRRCPGTAAGCASGRSDSAGRSRQVAKPLDLVGPGRVVADQPLQAVDLGRIVRGGDDGAAVGIQAALGMIDHRGGQLAQVDGIDSFAAEAVDQGVLEGRGGVADVAADDELGQRRQRSFPGPRPSGDRVPASIPRPPGPECHMVCRCSPSASQ